VKNTAPGLRALKCCGKWNLFTLYLASRWKKPSIYFELTRHQFLRDAYTEVEAYRADLELHTSPSSFLLTWISKKKKMREGDKYVAYFPCFIYLVNSIECAWETPRSGTLQKKVWSAKSRIGKEIRG